MSKLLKQLLWGANLRFNAVEDDGSGGVDGSDVEGTGNDARVALLNGISDGLDGERGEEFVEYDDNDQPIGNLSADDHEEEQHQEDDQQSASDDYGGQHQEPIKHRIKVNGRELELTTEELIERAQKVESADSYLAEAARIRKSVTEAQPSAEDAERSKVEEDLALARAIQMGTEEEAVAAIRSIRSAGPSPDAIAKTIDERLTFKEAISKFRNEYSDIANDPILNREAQIRDSEMIRAGDNRPYWERYKQIGDEMREWVKTITKSSSSAPEPKVSVNKEDRKKSAPTPPRAASGKATPVADEDKEESASDVIAAIAAARGGPQWMNSPGQARR